MDRIEDRTVGTDGAGGVEDALERKLCFDVYATNLAFSRLYAPLLQPHGLTYPQYLVLTLLWERDNRTMGELGEALALGSNTLTPLLKRMASSGLIGRERDSHDERRVHVALAEAGRGLRAALRHVPDCVEAATGFAEPDIRALQAQLRLVRVNLRARTS